MDEFEKHEVLHMSNFLCNAVAEELSQHPFVKSRSELFRLADAAEGALASLYQAIGAVEE